MLNLEPKILKLLRYLRKTKKKHIVLILDYIKKNYFFHLRFSISEYIEIYVSRFLKSKMCFPSTVQYIRIKRYMFLDYLKAKYVFQQFSSFIFFPGLQYPCLQVALCYKIQEKSKQLCSQVKSTAVSGKNKQMSAPEQHKVIRHRKLRILCVHMKPVLSGLCL